MWMEFFLISLLAGLVLVGAEIFVPGGILGAMGAVALLAAIVCGFFAFPGYGGWIAMTIVFLAGLAMAVWIRIFPSTRMGKRMTVSRNLADSKGTESGIESLLGKEGRTTSGLRPAGFALIDGRRVDVVTQGDMIEEGTPVQVVEVRGNRVVVRKMEQRKE